MADYGLGRILRHDVRDFKYLMDNVLPQRAPKGVTEKYWQDDEWYGDQGQTPHCVGFGWTAWVSDGPVTHQPVPPFDPNDLYYRCKEIDGEPQQEDGSSVRSGAQALQEWGFIESYHWAYNAATVARAILSAGPVVFGTNWYASMFEPDATHVIRINGDVEGGHCYVVNGYDRKTKLFRIKNSWGTGWGDNGHAFIGYDDVDRLLREQGEAVLALEAAK